MFVSTENNSYNSCSNYRSHCFNLRRCSNRTTAKYPKEIGTWWWCPSEWAMVRAIPWFEFLYQTPPIPMKRWKWASIWHKRCPKKASYQWHQFQKVVSTIAWSPKKCFYLITGYHKSVLILTPPSMQCIIFKRQEINFMMFKKCHLTHQCYENDRHWSSVESDGITSTFHWIRPNEWRPARFEPNHDDDLVITT